MDLQDKDSRPEKRVAFRAETRPFLDGKESEPYWIKQPILPGQGDRVNFSYDDEFLYVYASLQKLKSGQSYVFDQKALSGEQDPDLSRRDRFEIKIDVDRDYCSTAHFVVDYRGWAAEYCGGSKGWNPEWFLAIDHSDHQWSVEMAIPWSALSRTKPEPGSVWAISLQRLNYDSVSFGASKLGRKPVILWALGQR